MIKMIKINKEFELQRSLTHIYDIRDRFEIALQYWKKKKDEQKIKNCIHAINICDKLSKDYIKRLKRLYNNDKFTRSY